MISRIVIACLIAAATIGCNSQISESIGKRDSDVERRPPTFNPSPSPSATVSPPLPSATPNPSPTVAGPNNPSPTVTPAPTSSSSGLGKTYYISGKNGNDNNTDNQAQNANTPWKSVAKLNQFFPNLKPGDSVVFERGYVYPGQITTTANGTQTLPITIGAYGTGSKPEITSFSTLSGWTQVKDSSGNPRQGIWEASCATCGSTVRIVTLNGQAKAMGRWPNASDPNRGYRTFTSHNAKISISDTSLPSNPNWTGADLVLRTTHYTWDRTPILSHSGTTLTYDGSVNSYAPPAKFGYFIENSTYTLDQLGEWYFDPSTKKLQMYFGSGVPGAYVVKVSALDYGVKTYNFEDIRIDNLSFTGANDTGVYYYSSSRPHVTNCDFSFTGINGISFNTDSDNAVIEGNQVSYSNSWGIITLGSNNSIVRNNIVSNTANFAGMGANKANSYMGLRINGDSNLIQYNQVLDTGYIGIKFVGKAVKVKNNFVNGYCLVLDDCAGIYTNGPGTNGQESEVSGNIIVGGQGAPEGTDGTSKLVEGIYIDDAGSEVNITGNTVAHAPQGGIMIHNAHDLAVANNTFFDNGLQIYFSRNNAEQPAITAIGLNNNLLFSANTQQPFWHYSSLNDDVANFGNSDLNHFVRPLDPDGAGLWLSYPGVNGVWNLPGWRLFQGQDKNSTTSVVKLAPYQVSATIGTNKVSNGTFTTDVKGVGATKATVAFASSGGIDGGSLKITPTAVSAQVTLKIGTVTKGKSYRLRYSVKGTDNTSTALGAYLRLPSAPYTMIGPQIYKSISSSRTDNEIVFTATATETNSYLFFSTAGAKPAAPYYLDNIELMEVTGVATDPAKVFRFEYNASQSNRKVDLGTSAYADFKGVNYSGSITLAPYTSIILIKK